MVSACPDVAGVNEDEGDVGMRNPRMRMKCVMKRDARVSALKTSFRDEDSMESLKRSRAQKDPDYGSGSMVQKDSSIPLTPRGLSTEDEAMLTWKRG